VDGQSQARDALTSPRQRSGKRQHAAGRGLYERRNRQTGGATSERDLESSGQNTPAIPVALPRAAGLSLPRLSGIPSRYAVHTEVGDGAKLALGLLKAEIIDEADFIQNDDPASFIARSIGRLWTPEGLTDFGYSYTLTTVDDQLYFVVALEQAHYLDFSPTAALCDGLHPQLGPSLLSHLYRALPLTPAFTPEVCHDYIVMSHWCGWDGAEELLEMARNDLADAQGVTEESLSDEEVETYADSHYLTPNHVEALLEERYRRPGILDLSACRALCSREACPNLNTALDLLRELDTLAEALPERAEGFYCRFEGENPFALIVGLQRNTERDLVKEIFCEHEDLVWNSGFDFAPVYALGVDTSDSPNLDTLRTTLETCKRSLELTQTLLSTLEVATCLFP